MVSGRLQSDRISVRDNLEAVNRLFYARQWTDGLPIIPPTEKRVQTMLEGTSRKPEEIVGCIPPRWGEATVEKIAINAVMAGCQRTYLPVIITAIEAMLEEQVNLYAIQATTHPVAPLVIVNGPIVKKLDINYGSNVFGQGWWANATIGRTIRLILVNIGGGIPGKLDMATHGRPTKYSYCIAENEDENPWEPLHVERGFDKDTSTVTIFAGESPHNINDHMGTTAEAILSVAAETMVNVGMNQIWKFGGGGESLLVLGPEHAATIAGDGWSKDNVKQYIYENARLPVYKLRDRVMYRNRIWPRWIDTTSDNMMVPVVQDWKDIMVIVAGGPGKHSVCITNWMTSASITKAISP